MKFCCNIRMTSDTTTFLTAYESDCINVDVVLVVVAKTFIGKMMFHSRNNIRIVFLIEKLGRRKCFCEFNEINFQIEIHYSSNFAWCTHTHTL